MLKGQNDCCLNWKWSEMTLASEKSFSEIAFYCKDAESHYRLKFYLE